MAIPLVKICGLQDADMAIHAAAAGADFLGFVFVPMTVREISPERAGDIVLEVKEASFEEGFALPRFVGLFVDAGEKLFAETAPFLTHFQFHGHEDAERVDEIGTEFGLETIKAVGVATEDDVASAAAYQDAADMILFDARPPKGAAVTGGRGVAFDWSILKAHTCGASFMVAGGLNAANAPNAIGAARGVEGFAGVDVSSGVESARGVKDRALISSFLAAAKSASE